MAFSRNAVSGHSQPDLDAKQGIRRPLRLMSAGELRTAEGQTAKSVLERFESAPWVYRDIRTMR